MGRPVDAIPLQERARLSSPASPNALVDMIESYIDLGELDIAADLLEKALQLAPEREATHMRSLTLNALRAEWEKADRDAESILSSWGGYPPALRYLRDRDLARQDPSSAIERYRVFFPGHFSESPHDFVGIDFAAAIDLAYVLKLTGRNDLADSLLETSLVHLQTRPRLGWGGTGIGRCQSPRDPGRQCTRARVAR